jgi:hypothetical protein
VNDVIASRLSACIRVRGVAGGVDVDYPNETSRAYVERETVLAARGVRGEPYDEAVRLIIYGAAARYAASAGIDFLATLERFEAWWDRWKERRS